MRPIPTLIATLLIAAALAGCTATDGAPQSTPSDDVQDPGDGQNGEDAPPAPAPVAVLTVNVTEGTAPLEVTFSLSNAEGAANVTQWMLGFADGSPDARGTDLPAEVEHTYQANGTFEALLVVSSAQGNSAANVTILVEAPDVDEADPPQLVFSSGPVLGCVTEVGHGSCPAYELGPGNEAGFGLWIELEPGHVGMRFDAASTSGDSDGWLFGDASGDPIEAVHNGGGEVTGVVPPEAQWLLVVSWFFPSESLVVTFTEA